MTQRELIGFGVALASALCFAVGAWAKGSWPDGMLALGAGLGVMSGAFGYVSKTPTVPAVK